MNELVKKLSKGKHDVIVGGAPGSENPLQEFKDAIDREFVHIRFTKTKGGTELGFRLDQERSDLTKGDFDQGTGKVKVVGNITLDYVPVSVIADIDLSDLSGKGKLEVLEAEVKA